MLFDQKNKKIVHRIFIILGILIVIAMILLYFPALSYK